MYKLKIEKNIIKNKAGITLIALVISIIVLLILAGVSIMTLAGDNGLLNRTTSAKEKTEQAGIMENIRLAYQNALIGQYTNDGKSIENQIKEDLEKIYVGSTIEVNKEDDTYTVKTPDGTYSIDANGNVSKKEGIELLAKLELISGIDTTYQLTAVQKNIDTTLSWTSSEESVATVSSTGNITVVGPGTTDITVSGTYNNKNYSEKCKVTVSAVTIELGDDKEIIIGESETITPTITPASVATRDDITINWTSSAVSPSTWTATLNPTTGTSSTVGVPSEGATANTTSTITVTVKKGTTTLATDTCTITAKPSSYIDSSYVQYNVEYTDVYTETEYSAKTGWRLITDLSSYEATGTYTGDIEIISTGIPAKLYYDYNTIKSFEKASDTNGLIKGKWAGDATDRTNFTTEYYGTASYQNVYAASGLLYNFGNIVFNVTGTKDTLNKNTGGAFVDKQNYGGYIAISNNGTAVTASNTTTGNDLFKALVASGTVTVRSVNLKDIKNITTDSTDAITTTNDKKAGLFKLNDYTPDVHRLGDYWLASPIGDDLIGSLRYVTNSGGISSRGKLLLGLRPVITITGVKLQKNGNVWQIVAKSNE